MFEVLEDGEIGTFRIVVKNTAEEGIVSTFVMAPVWESLEDATTFCSRINAIDARMRHIKGDSLKPLHVMGQYLMDDPQHPGCSYLARNMPHICHDCGSPDSEQAMLFYWAGSAEPTEDYLIGKMNPGDSIKHYWTTCKTCGSGSYS